MEDDASKIPKQDKPGAPPPRQSLSIDYDLYQKYFDDSDLTEVQKREFLDALWSIMVSFVDLGFGLHPAQQVKVSKRDKNDIAAQVFGIEPNDLLVCDKHSRSQNCAAADGPLGSSRTRSQE